MKNKSTYTIIAVIVVIGLLINSCKKDNENSIVTLLSTGAWQLSSVKMTISVGDTVKLDTLLNTDCDTTQILTFKNDKTCTYTNFNCIDQPTARGHWDLTENRLFLTSDIVCKDSTAAGSSKPFRNAQINTVGNYSLVLLTGDIQNYTTTSKRTVIRYGFVRQKAATK